MIAFLSIGLLAITASLTAIQLRPPYWQLLAVVNTINAAICLWRAVAKAAAQIRGNDKCSSKPRV